MSELDTLIESAPVELTATLRELDQIGSSIKQRMQDLLQSHVTAKGWSAETHDIKFDIPTGMFAVVAKPPAAEAA